MSDINMDQVRGGFDQANQAAQYATNLSGAGGNLETSLREALTNRASDSNILRGANEAASEWFNVQPQIRADMTQMVQNQPLSAGTVQAIESARRSAALTPLVGANRLANIFTGGMENIIRGGVDNFRTLQDSAMQRAALMRQSAGDMFNLYQNQQQQRQQEIDNDLARQSLAKSGSGSGSGVLEQMLMAALGAGGGVPVGPQLPPSFVPDDQMIQPSQPQTPSAQLNLPNANFTPSLYQRISGFFGNLFGRR